VDVGAYFETIKFILVAASIVVLFLIFLYMFYGKEEKTE